MGFVTKARASRWRFGVLLLLAASTSSCSSGPNPVDADLQQCSAQWNKIIPLLQQELTVAKNPQAREADVDAAANAADKFTAELAKVQPQTPEVQKLQADLASMDKGLGDTFVDWATNLRVYEKSSQEARFAQDYFGKKGYTEAAQQAAQRAPQLQQAVLAYESQLQQWE